MRRLESDQFGAQQHQKLGLAMRQPLSTTPRGLLHSFSSFNVFKILQ
jgi:hypothetical protein